MTRKMSLRGTKVTKQSTAKKIILTLLAIFATNSFAQSTTAQSTASATAAQPAAAAPADTQATASMADAQKAYVAGKWKDAAAAYEAACPKEPDSLKAECYLWNVLALSQTGNAKDFSKAGKRLDSLINKTSPQHRVYADLMMTKAQFQLYMGRNAKAAEALIHAIETSQPHQVTVLKKICSAIQPTVKNPTLDETCKKLDEPRETASTAVANVDTVKAVDSTKTDTNKVAATAAPDTAKPKPEAAKPDTANVVPPPAVQPSAEYWYLQLGAFSVKSNADLLVSSLKKQGITGTIEERTGETKTLYLVQTGKFETKEKAIDYGAKKLAPLNVEFRALLRK